MLFSVFYVGDSCQGWGQEFEPPFPLQIQKSPSRKIRAFFLCFNSYLILNHGFIRLYPRFKATIQMRHIAIAQCL
ncbi:hypothetical protein FPV60_13505 [Acinetobacter colistiniresistens]|uniref:Uncharacterized protein n=1 Tax=Acinetobacter colistiniresistens TaxID=280145 RepID=A0A558F2X7_9GAMM|nr:hypothetical protein FPV60_13505 [Acinetobacter colistiniresistens]